MQNNVEQKERHKNGNKKDSHHNGLPDQQSAADRALGEKSDSEIFHVPPARAAAIRWRQASLGFVVLLFLGMMLVSKYPQILKPLVDRHMKQVMRSIAATNSAAPSRPKTPGIMDTASVKVLSATNAAEATNEPSRLQQP